MSAAMVSNAQEKGALGALNAALVLLRQLASDRIDGAELAALLDLIEYLPRLLAADDERSAEFRQVLLDLTYLRPEFQLALDRFDHRSESW